jgi:hypothetical protein
MDPIKKIQALEADRDALKKALAQQGTDKDERIAIHGRIIAVEDQITALINRIVPETKIVKFLDEDGAQQQREVNAATFDRWVDTSALVPVQLDDDAASTPTLIRSFGAVDEATLYRFVHHPIDIKACVQHLVDTQELEFGKACEQLVHSSCKDFRGFEVVKTTARSKTGKAPPANPYAYRLDDKVEVDFFAKNGKDAVAGMFQLTMPREKKINSFFDNCKKLHPPATKFIFGVSLANPVALQRLQKQFTAVLVRSATGFCRL